MDTHMSRSAEELAAVRQAAAPWMASSLKGEARSEAWIERLQAIKPGAVLLNFARDAIVDEAAESPRRAPGG